MILVRWQGEWALAQRLRPTSTGCSLRVPNASRFATESNGFRADRFGGYWSRPFDQMTDMKCFPVLKFRGAPVRAINWHPKSEEPLVRCHMEPHHLVPDGNTERYMRLVEEMKAQEWEWDIREGGDAYIHVDELEKIEGPPPEGPF